MLRSNSQPPGGVAPIPNTVQAEVVYVPHVPLSFQSLSFYLGHGKNALYNLSPTAFLGSVMLCTGSVCYTTLPHQRGRGSIVNRPYKISAQCDNEAILVEVF